MSSSIASGPRNLYEDPKTWVSLTQDQCLSLMKAVSEARLKHRERFYGTDGLHISYDTHKCNPGFNKICRIKVFDAILDCMFRVDFLRLTQAKIVKTANPPGSTAELVQNYEQLAEVRRKRICRLPKSRQCGLGPAPLVQSQGSQKVVLDGSDLDALADMPTPRDMTHLLQGSMDSIKQEHVALVINTKKKLKTIKNNKNERLQKLLSREKIYPKPHCSPKKLKKIETMNAQAETRAKAAVSKASDEQTKINCLEELMQKQLTEIQQHIQKYYHTDCVINTAQGSGFVYTSNAVLTFYDAWEKKVGDVKGKYRLYKEAIQTGLQGLGVKIQPAR